MKHMLIAVAAVTIALAPVGSKPVSAQPEVSDAPIRSAVVADFSISVPNDWTNFTTQEAATFEKQYQLQSREVYQHFAGKDDSTKSVKVAAYHTPGKNGAFVIVAMSLPAQANLMPMLQEQVQPKMQYGIQQGFIRRY